MKLALCINKVYEINLHSKPITIEYKTELNPSVLIPTFRICMQSPFSIIRIYL